MYVHKNFLGPKIHLLETRLNLRIFSRSRDNNMNIINNTYMLLIIC